MTYKIDDYAPVEPKHKAGTKPYKYPFGGLRAPQLDSSGVLLAQSFVVPLPPRKKVAAFRSHVSAYAKYYAQRNGGQFTSRLVKDEAGNPTGIRVYRIA